MMKKEEDKFYGIVDGEDVPFEVPAAGSLGLLAFGDLGVIAWRKAKIEAHRTTKDNSENEERPGNGKE